MLYPQRLAALLVFLFAALVGTVSGAAAQQPQRLALVVGQGAYESGQLPTAVNDAGLMAQALTSAGFEVVQGADLTASDLRRLVREFLDKAQSLEPGSAVAVYLSGYGLQLEGENYLIPVDARIERDTDIPIDGFRLSDIVRALERTPAQTRILIADMVRDYPMPAGAEVARGLAVMEAPQGFLIAYSSSPNITAQDGQGPYGAYASAVVEMMRQPGLRLDDVFARARLRTHEATNGQQTPWHTANIGDDPFVFFETAEGAAPAPAPQARRIEDVSPEEAYAIAVERDTIQDYQAFLRRYPDHQLARRVTAVLAARREALVWRRTLVRNSSEAYWTYLRRYPNGPHAEDSRRRLARLAAPIAPPAVFEEVVYEDLPPPLPVVETVEVVEVVTIIREAPPPPPVPVYLLPARDYDDELVVTIFREPPPRPIMRGILPIPVPIPIPTRARPPAMFYQPIAPVTPRGAVAIPVARPPIIGGIMGNGPGSPRPTRAPRPQQPTLPDQPALTAPLQPISLPRDQVRPPRERPGVRPDLSPRQPRSAVLPSRPIPLEVQGSTLGQQDAPGTVQDQPNRVVLPTGPAAVPRAARPVRPGADDPTRLLPPAVAPNRLRPEAARPERPGRDARRPDFGNPVAVPQQTQPEAGEQIERPNQSSPALVPGARRPSAAVPVERRPAREILPRGADRLPDLRPERDARPRPDRPLVERPTRDAARPPAVQQDLPRQNLPRREFPRPEFQGQDIPRDVQPRRAPPFAAEPRERREPRELRELRERPVERPRMPDAMARPARPMPEMAPRQARPAMPEFRQERPRPAPAMERPAPRMEMPRMEQPGRPAARPALEASPDRPRGGGGGGGGRPQGCVPQPGRPCPKG